MGISKTFSIKIKGNTTVFTSPIVMGILNVTPDSFFEGSRKQTEQEIAQRANQIISEGGTIIDVGAFSTRPGAQEVSEEEEMARLRSALNIIKKQQPEVILSVDTFRPDVARMVVEEYGVDIINDVSEGGITGIVDTPLEGNKEAVPAIFRMVAQLKVPYILMSVKPTIDAMKTSFKNEIQCLEALGHDDIILDPGYGFGKTIEQNYAILNRQEELLPFNKPLLVGVSRKRMIRQLCNSSPAGALAGTTAVNTLALMHGAHILRVHDVREATDVIKVTQAFNNNKD